MRVIVPGPLGWQSSLPIQMTRSPNVSLRAMAVFMLMPPDDRWRRKKDRWAATLGTARPIPLWRLRSGPRSSPIDQCSDFAPRTSRTPTNAQPCIKFRFSQPLLWLRQQALDKIAYDLYLLDIIVRDFHASELVLNR